MSKGIHTYSRSLRQVIMRTKSPIRVIKREERNRRESAIENADDARKTPKETARDMVSTVSTWVSEFKQNRRDETKKAFSTLFPDPPQTSGI